MTKNQQRKLILIEAITKNTVYGKDSGLRLNVTRDLAKMSVWTLAGLKTLIDCKGKGSK